MTDHDKGCDCGCGEHEEQEEILTLIDENGEERNFSIIEILEVDGSEYAILLPVEGEVEAEEDADEAIILKFAEDEEGNEILVEIEDDEEWEKVADAWEDLIAQDES